MTDAEEEGHDHGFANEGRWPISRVAHVRPVFRGSEWQAPRAINRRFADAVVAGARSDKPVVLVQDVHFALLPAMIRAGLPSATILTSRHIPGPNPESLGICPCRREILVSMLASTILGFHTRFPCRNLIETVDRFLAARTEHGHSTIRFHDEGTLVACYPVLNDAAQAARTPLADSRRAGFDRLDLWESTCLAVGVDRFGVRRAGPMRSEAARWPQLARAGSLRERIEARVQRHRVERDAAVPTFAAFAAPRGREQPRRGPGDASVPSGGRGPWT